jgi:hypothetical protein
LFGFDPLASKDHDYEDGEVEVSSSEDEEEDYEEVVEE